MSDLPHIGSRSNAHFRTVRALATSAAQRRRSGRTLLDGAHLVAAYLERARPAFIAVSESMCGDIEVRQILERAPGVPCARFSDLLFAQLAPVRAPTGILAVIDIPRDPPARPRGSLLVMLDAIQDPGNVGTIIRSAAAAGADAVLLSAQCADAWAPRTLRAAMGAHFALAIHVRCDLERVARNFEGRVIAAAGQGGAAPHELSLLGSIALVFGSEGAGLSEPLAKVAHAVTSIPLARGVESLNVGAAAAIILFERARQIAMTSPLRGSSSAPQP